MLRIGSWLRSRRATVRTPPASRKAVDASAPDNPPDPRALLAQGNAQLDRGDLVTAEHCYRRASVLAPDLGDARVNLGFVLREAGRAREALAELEAAATLAPDSADAHYLLGVVRQELGDLAGAIPPFQRATDLQPSLAPAHRDLGKALFDTGLVEEAERALRRGMSAVPTNAELPFFLGNVYAESQRFESALECYRTALALQPDVAAVHSNMVPALINACDFGGAVASAQMALRLDPSSLNAHSNLLMALSRDPDCTPARYLAHAREFGKVVTALAENDSGAGTVKAAHELVDLDGTVPRSLRIGFVSGDLRHHPVGYFLERVLAHWDQTRMALVVFANQRGGDDLTARLRAHAGAWHDIARLDDDAAARLIAAEGIDVLVDLSGHTPRNRLPLFARRAAPVQATWLGYWASTGVPAIEHLLADPVSVPDAHRGDFTEHVWHLPETRLCFSPPDHAPAVAPLPALQSGYLTFGSFQSMVKLNDDVLRLWARVLRAVPGSRLRLQSLQFVDAAGQAGMRKRLNDACIERSRVELALPGTRRQYLAAHAEVDIILDTFPHSGGTTTCEALWMGVPTLTLPGRTMLARQGAALLHAAGLDDWIARDEREFAERAAGFAAQIDVLARLRSMMREKVRASPLFDSERFALALQTTLRQIAAEDDGKPFSPAFILSGRAGETNQGTA